MTITSQDAPKYIGQSLHDNEGDKIGKIGAIYLDDVTGEPEWVTVSTGFFGSNESFVPVDGATAQDDDLRVPYSKDTVKDAPNVDLDEGHLSADEEAELYRYYEGHTGTAGTGDTETQKPAHRAAETVDAEPAPSSHADEAMTRSEEQLNVGTETVTTGKARLRRWVETEHQSVDVPVRKEKVRLETEPVTDANRHEVGTGPEISEGEQEITLTEERPVVTTEAVPVERVRIGKEVEESSTTVEADVRKERIDLDDDQR